MARNKKVTESESLKKSKRSNIVAIRKNFIRNKEIRNFGSRRKTKKNAFAIYRDLEHEPSDLSAVASKYKNYYAEQQRKELIAESVAATEKMVNDFKRENSNEGTGFKKGIHTLLTELDQAWKENTDKDNMERQLRELSEGIGKIVPEGASKFSYGFLNSMYDSYTSAFFLMKDFYRKKETWDYLTSFSFYRDLICLNGEAHQEIWTPIFTSYGEDMGNSLFFFLHGTSEQRGYAAYHLCSLTKMTRAYSKQISHAYFNRALTDFRNPSKLGRAISGSASLDLSPDNEIRKLLLDVKKGKELKDLLKPMVPPVQTKEEPRN